MRVAVRRFVPCLAALLAFPHAALAQAPDPYAIYAKARAEWAAVRYPPYVSYTIAVTVDDHGVEKADHYQALYDAARNQVFVNTISEEQQIDPHLPRGINMSVDPKRQFKTLFKRRVGRPEAAVDYLGVPMLAPNYSFGVVSYVPRIASSATDRAALVEEIRREFNDPMPAQKEEELEAGEGPKRIADVVSAQRDYRIVFDGIEAAGGANCYHLSLQPVHPSSRLRLRELWIDTQTYATRKLVTQGNFDDDRIPWTVTFATIDGAQYIASETALKPVSDGRYTYAQATISFEGIVPSAPPQHPWDLVTPTNDVLNEP